MEKIKLDIIGISYSQSQSGAYALILGESKGKRRLPIIIGGFEAQAIAVELEKMKPARPLTHDLFKNFSEAYNIKIIEVNINRFHEGVFYARLVCFNDEDIKEVDARTSDAVALAVRFDCPIFTNDKVLSEAGVVFEETENEEVTEESNPEISSKKDQEDAGEFSAFSISELEKILGEAVQNEEFERASKIRDEINHRKKRK